VTRQRLARDDQRARIQRRQCAAVGLRHAPAQVPRAAEATHQRTAGAFGVVVVERLQMLLAPRVEHHRKVAVRVVEERQFEVGQA
jgi:hypothetical protein